MTSCSRTTAHPSPHPASAPGPVASTCTVLLAVHESRRTPLCELLASVAPDGRCLVATSLVDATLQLVRGPVDLLVLDLQLEPGQPLALIHLLARFAPASRILAFGETDSALPVLPYRMHGWPAAPGALSAAIAAIAACRAADAEASRR